MAKWWLIGAGVALAALLIASIALALTSNETEFANGTPEHAVQTVLRAAQAHNIQTTYDMLAAELQEKCELGEFVNAHNSSYYHERDFGAALRATKSVNDLTLIDVRITQFYGSGPFDSGESHMNTHFTLRQENGEWKFTEYPWPYNYCPESDDE